MYGNNLSTEIHITLLLIFSKHSSTQFISLFKIVQWSPLQPLAQAITERKMSEFYFMIWCPASISKNIVSIIPLHLTIDIT